MSPVGAGVKESLDTSSETEILDGLRHCISWFRRDARALLLEREARDCLVKPGLLSRYDDVHTVRTEGSTHELQSCHRQTELERGDCAWLEADSLDKVSWQQQPSWH